MARYICDGNSVMTRQRAVLDELLGQVRWRQRSRQKEPLTLVTTMVTQPIELALALDSLGGHLRSQALPQ